MCNDAHGDEHDHKIHPDGGVSQPTVLGKSPHLADTKSNDGPDQTADSVAKLEFGHLRDSLSIADHDQAHVAEKLDGLEDVDYVARNRTVEAECQISVVLHGELVGVKTQEDFPQQITGAGRCVSL